MKYFDKLKESHGLEWPYPIKYDQENRLTADVLILGGGLSGCFAAMHAAKAGASVIIVEKGATKRSGAAGAGIDHWSETYTNPCSKYTPDDIIAIQDSHDPFISGIASYIRMTESYDAMLDFESIGVKVRDVDGEFEGAPFRDPKTKLMFAYDYDARDICRIYGHDLKPRLYDELVRLGVTIVDRVMATCILTEGGKQGGRAIGATGFNVRTGEFYMFNAKAVITATAKPLRLWDFSTELVGSNSAHDDPNCAGDGAVMAYKIGAEFMLMEKSHSSSAGKRYPAYGTGNAHNTWYPCTIVDANGKQIPWVDRDGKVLKTVSERSHSAEGQMLFMHGPACGPYDTQGPHLISDLPQRIRSGEFKLPFYADLPSMPDEERRVIFGLMLGNEGKTRIPVIKNLRDAGFDPEKDMLQANVLSPEFAGAYEPWWDVKSSGVSGPNVREVGFHYFGGVTVDWKLQTSIPGLFAIGNEIAGSDGAATAGATGRYCGRIVADYVKTQALHALDMDQISKEKERIYRPVHKENGYGWKEVQLGLCRIMQSYCGDVKSKEVLEMGLWWMNSIQENEIKNLSVSNPHELARALECDIRCEVGKIIMWQSLQRKTSCPALGFERITDEGQQDKENTYITIRDVDGQPVYGEKEYYYWLRGENAPTYKENYLKNACL